jgi:hypothetical protein
VLGRLLLQNAKGIAALGGFCIAIWITGFWFGTQTLPQPAPSPEVLAVRAEAIGRCFRETSSRLNRTQPDPEVLASINEQCRRIYDVR